MATAAGQVPDTTRRQPAIAIGQVVDTGGVGIADAQVLVLAGDKPIVGPIASDSQGNFRFRSLPSGGPYTLIARKIGYKSARGRNFYIVEGDTLRLRFVLPPVVVVLAPIVVKGRRRDRSSLFADEFASKVKIYRDALDLMVWYRPDMLGDPEFCSSPDSFSRPRHDRFRLRLSKNLMLYSGESQGGHIHRPWLDALRFGSGMSEPALPYVRQVYVNGLRVDRPGDPIRTPLRMLRAIPSKYIAEMRYIDCWDKSMALGMQYSIFVILRPLSPEQEDRVFRFLLAQPTASGPIDGRVMSVNRPGQETLDSIVRLLTGRDSAAYDSAKAETSP